MPGSVDDALEARHGWGCCVLSCFERRACAIYSGRFAEYGPLQDESLMRSKTFRTRLATTLITAPRQGWRADHPPEPAVTIHSGGQTAHLSM
jgi:hypothetical protein